MRCLVCTYFREVDGLRCSLCGAQRPSEEAKREWQRRREFYVYPKTPEELTRLAYTWTPSRK
jgi:hypothetical protein